MNKIWKNSTDGTIVILRDIPTDGQYTDETNIANWIGMMRKKNMSLNEIHSGVTDYINEKVQLSVDLTAYDTKWLEIYNNLLPSISIDDPFSIDNDL